MEKSGKVFILTGAGVSAESGIPVFQGTNWRGRSHYELANIDAWRADPGLVWDYYSERRKRARDAKPNRAHQALAEFERSRPAGSCFLCTQNVDGLHEAAGSVNVLHIHGKLFENRCADECGKPAVADSSGYSAGDLPLCVCGALLRPNVCWFGEQPYEMDRVHEELEQCDVFLAIGTSGSVQPVASFVAMLKQRRKPARTIFAGLERPANAHYFDDVRLGPASVTVPEVLRGL
ncbi:MAG: NAD-dependent deacylase [Acidobacteriia bacterium]|nr:NAD-dependent deacylase [Terriglobia bacterium]